MKLRPSIFDSKSEAEIFRSLSSRWTPKLALYPSVPFPKIIEVSGEELRPKERDFFYKTNIDYTFCVGSGRPILSIEFDGIGGGYSKNGAYIPARPTIDPYRKLKLDFKLKLARKVNYPFVVVSYDEARMFDSDESLMFLDGIIGEVVAQDEFQRRVAEMYEESRPEIGRIEGADRDELLQDLVLAAEVEAEMAVDPVAQKASQYECLASDRKLAQRISESYLHDPPLPDMKDFFDVRALKARIAGIQKAVEVGYEITVDTPKGHVREAVWLRNFEGLGISPSSIAKKIAEYLVFKRACGDQAV
ncbi:MAG TPA: hypothetical protein VNL17_13240 [Verrucomicrobiae bacterium]|nr:hypothetical protein [Verrucomicrobiae bacterium]